MRNLADVIPLNNLQEGQPIQVDRRLLIPGLLATVLALTGYPKPASYVAAGIILAVAGDFLRSQAREWKDATTRWIIATIGVLVAIGAVWLAMLLLMTLLQRDFG